MPTLPQQILETAVYLYRDEASALAGKNFGGSGFMVAVPSVRFPEASYHYVVTNHHIAATKGCSVVRLNGNDGGINTLIYDPADWEFTSGSGDVAVAMVDRPDPKRNIYIGPNDFLTRAEYEEDWGVGEDVVMVGRFIGHDGGQTNRPAARFGNISIGPTPLPNVPNSCPQTEYFCIDMRSRSGFSGSAVFVYRTPGSDLRQKGTALRAPKIKLLGIQVGQFREEAYSALEGDKENEKVFTASGMAYVLPAWTLLEFLQSEKMVQARALEDLKI